jgi:hypothetical protein
LYRRLLDVITVVLAKVVNDEVGDLPVILVRQTELLLGICCAVSFGL